MFNYMPERIYAKVKDDDKYKEAIKLLEDTYLTKAEDAKSVMGYDKAMYTSRELYPDFAAKYLAMLEEVVQRLCPEFMVEYKIIYEYYKSKDELIAIYNDTKNDDETRLICLSDIINLSYTDTTYDRWTNEFLDFYDKCDPKEIPGFSGYIHLKEMHMKIYMHTYNFAGKEITQEMVDEALAFNKATLEVCLKNYPDNDAIYNGYIEACTDSLQNLVALSTDVNMLIYYANAIANEDDTRNYQYHDYSFAVMLLQDKKNDLYLLSGRHTEFIHGTIKVMKYISNAYKDVDSLARGLLYYDKRNIGNFMCLLRKYIKLKSIAPVMRRSDLFQITGIPKEDYDMALSEIFYSADIKTAYSENSATIVSRDRDSVDQFLSADNKPLQDFCKIQ